MENKDKERKGGLSGRALRIWGMLFLTLGMIGRGVLQTGLLGIGQVSDQQLLEAMQNSQGAMVIATASLILQAVETCAAPIFAFLLVEGFVHTSDWKRYLLRVAGVALLCEIPFNLISSGSLIAMNSRNPVFGLVLGLIMLCFYRRFSESTMQDRMIKVVVSLAGFLWAAMLGIESGICLVLIICILWAFRENPMIRNFAGAIAAVVCTAMSPFYMAAPMGFLVVHFYNGDKGNGNRIVQYLYYPVMMLIVGVISAFVL